MSRGIKLCVLPTGQCHFLLPVADTGDMASWRLFTLVFFIVPHYLQASLNPQATVCAPARSIKDSECDDKRFYRTLHLSLLLATRTSDPSAFQGNHCL